MMSLESMTVKELKTLAKNIRNELKRRSSVAKRKPKKFSWTLYMLELEDDYYYIGITRKTPEARFREHCDGTGAKWTALHKPVSIMNTKDLGKLTEVDAIDEETMATVYYMREFGYEKVRGGKLVALDDSTIRYLLAGIGVPSDIIKT